MIATVVRDFVYAKQNKRYRIGDVISVSTDEFERINLNRRPILVEGKINVGSGGKCYPCEKVKSKKTEKK